MSEITVSVIIPTKNRPNELSPMFDQLLNQTKNPKEIIVVDDSTDSITEEVCERFHPLVEYVKNSGNSITSARNLGVTCSRGEIILFLDDDIELHKDYIEKITNHFSSTPETLGLSGFDESVWQLYIPKHIQTVFRMIGLPYMLNGKCKLAPTITALSSTLSDTPIPAEWLPGHNMAYRKEIFKEFRFDEWFSGYGLGEDLDFSYRIFKKYPNSLKVLPEAKVFHRHSKTSRSNHLKKWKMETRNETYLFKKLFRKTPINVMLFMWKRAFSIVGLPLLMLHQAKKGDKSVYVLKDIFSKKSGD